MLPVATISPVPLSPPLHRHSRICPHAHLTTLTMIQPSALSLGASMRDRNGPPIGFLCRSGRESLARRGCGSNSCALPAESERPFRAITLRNYSHPVCVAEGIRFGARPLILHIANIFVAFSVRDFNEFRGDASLAMDKRRTPPGAGPANHEYSCYPGVISPSPTQTRPSASGKSVQSVRNLRDLHQQNAL